LYPKDDIFDWSKDYPFQRYVCVYQDIGRHPFLFVLFYNSWAAENAQTCTINCDRFGNLDLHMNFITVRVIVCAFTCPESPLPSQSF
jgi:hypothetical protein